MWIDEIKRLAEVATSQPQAAYSAFTHGLTSCWTYLLRTIPDIQDLLIPLKSEIHQTFIPGRPPCSKLERDLLSLPVRLSGMGLINPVTTSVHSFSASQHITAPLAAMIVTQEINKTTDPHLSEKLQ